MGRTSGRLARLLGRISIFPDQDPVWVPPIVVDTTSSTPQMAMFSCYFLILHACVRTTRFSLPLGSSGTASTHDKVTPPSPSSAAIIRGRKHVLFVKTCCTMPIHRPSCSFASLQLSLNQASFHMPGSRFPSTSAQLPFQRMS